MLSWVDQITQPYLYNVLNYLLWGAVISITFAAVSDIFLAGIRVVYYFCSVLIFVLFLFSVQAWGVDTYDMFAHLKIERSIFNIISAIALFILAIKTKPTKIGKLQ